MPGAHPSWVNLHLQQRGCFFTMQTHLYNLAVQVAEPREVAESPPWEIFQSCLDVVLSNLLSVALLEQRLDQGTSRGPFPPLLQPRISQKSPCKPNRRPQPLGSQLAPPECSLCSTSTTACPPQLCGAAGPPLPFPACVPSPAAPQWSDMYQAPSSFLPHLPKRQLSAAAGG